MPNKTDIPFLDLKAITALHQEQIDEALLRTAHSGWFLRGQETEQFEAAYAQYIGVPYCIGCGNGLDALTLIFMAYKEMGLMSDGDEVVVPANTYIASILAITRCQLKPVLVEPDIDTLQIDSRKIEEAITPRTKALMIVHLYGRCAYTEAIGSICARHHLRLVEDNAQAHGCVYHQEEAYSGVSRTGSFGDAAHSFYPTKNLGALGDAGAVTTRDAELAHLVRALGNYGSGEKYVFDHLGINSRMDEMQAAILRAKLPYLDQENEVRRQHALFYYKALDNACVHFLPASYLSDNVFHLFPVLCDDRDALRAHLAQQHIQTDVHYPIPPHKQRCYSQYNKASFPVTEYIHSHILSLPISQVLTQEQQETVADAINHFHTTHP